MKTKITFAQVAHLYLRSELEVFQTGSYPYFVLSNLTYNHLDKKMLPIPYFQPFENLIKPVKANKFVAELLGINEGDEYVMAKYFRSGFHGVKFEIKNDNLFCYFEDGSKTYLCHNMFNNLNPEEQIYLIAAGYNVFNIKDCEYETV